MASAGLTSLRWLANAQTIRLFGFRGRSLLMRVGTSPGSGLPGGKEQKNLEIDLAFLEDEDQGVILPLDLGSQWESHGLQRQQEKGAGYASAAMPDALFFQATVLDGALAMPLSLDACAASVRASKGKSRAQLAAADVARLVSGGGKLTAETVTWAVLEGGGVSPSGLQQRAGIESIAQALDARRALQHQLKIRVAKGCGTGGPRRGWIVSATLPCNGAGPPVTGLLIAASAEEILIVSWLLLRMYRRRLVPWVVWPLPDVQHVGVDEVACRAMPEQFGWCVVCGAVPRIPSNEVELSDAMVYVGRQVLVGLLLPLLVSSSHHKRHARHSHHHVSHTQADHEDHHQSKLQNLQKAVIKDEVKETELQLQETRDREAIRITEEEVGRVGRDWGMLRSLQKHGQRKPSEEDLKVGEANLRELKSQMKQLQKGLNYAKEYVSDSEAQREKLKAAIANSTLPEELKDAKHKYEQLQKHVTKATMKENAAWKDTVKREVELGEAKEQYSKNLKRLAAEEAELRSASAKLRQLKAGDESTTKQPAEGEPASERSGLSSRHAGWFAASVALSLVVV
ncbi:hypothetical protein AK812_SmicGene24494 [Symbiodinium microadriaticum]|uniref:Uncharacterized protein n=1 Tax=Symbiodinium microadriaticum TaxID=2951 RepID=A0A1Q9DEL3_SYMMI|nr:hypothetical protein AK812_SmicGene24494 [Symbiodinium microadriaticum]